MRIFLCISPPHDAIIRQLFYPLESKHIPWKLMVGRWNSLFEWSLFRGSMSIFRGVFFFFGYFMFMCDFTCLALQQGASHFCCHLQKNCHGRFVDAESCGFFLRQNCYYERGHPLPPVGVPKCWRRLGSVCCTGILPENWNRRPCGRRWNDRIWYRFDMNDAWIVCMLRWQ